MRELSTEEMELVSGGNSGSVGGKGLPPLSGYTPVGKANALAYLVTIQTELDGLKVNEQIWSSLSDS